jgi:hypothetical protein
MRRRTLLAILAVSLGVTACEANLTHPGDAVEAGVDASLSCVPNLDGVIDSTELQPTLGLAASYLISPSGSTRPVDVAGTIDSSGQLVWDWGTSYSNDRVDSVEAYPLQGKWYASTFPDGQFATTFDAAGTLEAVYSQDANGLYLHGLASKDENPAQGQTLWAYDTPVVLYVFPLKPGTSWSSSGTIRGGVVDGQPYNATDKYEGTDDTTGRLVLPDFTFTQAHRLRFVVTTTFSAGTNPEVNRQVSFLCECFGEVARATSQTIDTNQNFTTAAEQRRLGH